MNHAKHLLVLSAVVATPLAASASFTLFDDFSYSPGSNLVGQGPAGNQWAQTMPAGINSGMVVNGAGQVDVLGGTIVTAANRSLATPGLSIVNSSTAATAFFQFNPASTTGENWNFILTDVVPNDTAGTSEVQFNFDSTQPGFRARNGTAFKSLSVDGTAGGLVQVVAGVTYNVWMQINNSTDTYQVFMQSDSVPGLASRTQVFANDGTGGTFTFRNSSGGVQPNDLNNLNFGSGSAQANPVTFDNFYVDTAGFNSLNPVAVPEPTTFALLGLGGLGLAIARRRKSV